ncbi:resistin-like gamma [Glandiceps talaboti]
MRSIWIYFVLVVLIICGVSVLAYRGTRSDSDCESISCISRNHSSLRATCPVGYVVIGCSCGNDCGSYIIEDASANQQGCYCHPRSDCNSEWTTARCCQLQTNVDQSGQVFIKLP